MSTRPPPSRGRGLSYTPRTSLRPVVIAIGVVTAIWCLLWAIGSFETISTDKDHQQPKLAVLAIIVGAIYVGACVVEILGVIAASLRHRMMVRIYALLSVVSSFAIVGAALIRVIVHFMLKNDLIDECEQIVQGTEVFYQFGFWGPTYETKLNVSDAASYCRDAWNHDSFVEIISLIVELLLSVFFTMVAFAYYRQVLDPTSAANVSRRAPVMGAEDAEGSEYPAHYNPPYLGYDTPYAPPPGAPPAPYDPVSKAAPYDPTSKPPSYVDAGYGGGDGAALKDDPFADFETRSMGAPDKVDPFAEPLHMPEPQLQPQPQPHPGEHGPGAGESRFVEERGSLM